MRFINSWANKLLRFSDVEVEHKGEKFVGRAYCHPDDIFSEFTGCRYAEMRAQIKALKAEHRKAKAACEECRKFVVAVTQYKQFNPEDPSSKAMFRQLNQRIKAVNRLAEEISKMEFNLRLAIRQQDRFIEKSKND